MQKKIVAALLLLICAVVSKASIPYAISTSTATIAESVVSSMQKLSGSSISGDVFVMSPMEMLAEDEEADDEFDTESLALDAHESLTADIISTAKKFLGRPYRFGAKGPKAFDCSGFTGYVFRSNGVNLGCDSRAQAVQGEHVSMADVRPGDLIFFSGRAGGSRVGHVGMVAEVNPENGTMTFIHASTRRGVVMQKYPDGGYYSRHFLKFRRVIGDEKLLASK